MKPPRQKRPRQKDPRGRKALPPDLVKVNLVCRVPARVRDGFKKRAKDHGTDSQGRKRSSVGLEVERAFDASATPLDNVEMSHEPERRNNLCQ